MFKSVKFFVLGLILGALVAFPLGINFGRDMPLLSNPFEKPTMKDRVKQKASQLLDETKQAIHKATEPTNPAK